MLIVKTIVCHGDTEGPGFVAVFQTDSDDMEIVFGSLDEWYEFDRQLPLEFSSYWSAGNA